MRRAAPDDDDDYKTFKNAWDYKVKMNQLPEHVIKGWQALKYENVDKNKKKQHISLRPRRG